MKEIDIQIHTARKWENFTHGVGFLDLLITVLSQLFLFCERIKQLNSELERTFEHSFWWHKRRILINAGLMQCSD